MGRSAGEQGEGEAAMFGTGVPLEISLVVHSLQGSASTQDWVCCFERHLNAHNVCTSVYACGRGIGVDC